MLLPIDIAANLAAIRERIAAAAARSGRTPDEITLVAVSKNQPIAAIEAALAAGQREFGENRVEDAWAKFAEAPPSARVHLIGPIQSRKAALAVACRPVLIHAVDRLKIAHRLDRFAAESDVRLEVLLEVNLSGEASKFGFTREGLQVALDDLLALPRLRVRGLMTMPPYDPDPEAARPFFDELRELQAQLASRWPEAAWDHLSMGMSHDFEVAIEEGATLVRIGTAIFGARDG